MSAAGSGVIKVAWSGAGTPTEEQLRRLVEEEGLTCYDWSNGPGYDYAAHEHAYHKVLYCLRGSITFTLPDDGQEVQLGPGDRLELPAGKRHGARVGPEGVTCLEAHR